MRDRSERTSSRRRFLITSGALGTGLAAGCLDESSSGNGNGNGETNGTTTGSVDETTISWILNPAESDVDIVAQYQPLFDYVESEVDVTIEPNRAQSYTATIQELRRGAGELADTSPSAAVAAKDVADVIGIRVAYGAAQYFSLITTTPDSDISELADLEGEEVAMGATMSVSGTLVPMMMLSQAGLDTGSAPDGDPPDFTPRYSDHSTARDQLINNPSIAAATTGAFSTAPHVPQEQFDELSQDFVDISAEYENAGSEEPELELLAVSDPIPRAPLMARSDWDDPIREDVEEAILNVEAEDLEHGDDYEGEELWFSGVESGSVEDYAPIEDVMDELGLEFKDLS
ncbi:PhnD/SsuA/transferrin family substrate-binding protein [Halopiger aswanensis]|uniref:Phosphonate transport system substrate-binding protein n=1 Tax=Halopiger aswanensis TaxID=148449 RepID=A0A419WF46_9EURY|nr:PhnD/SsuA/transferrin family substrate-binding protein [Halopiger aswanensis]RKD94012.1 phosphonate transport system substrate-binding protein [Halopiger aswanensis]